MFSWTSLVINLDMRGLDFKPALLSMIQAKSMVHGYYLGVVVDMGVGTEAIGRNGVLEASKEWKTSAGWGKRSAWGNVGKLVVWLRS